MELIKGPVGGGLDLLHWGMVRAFDRSPEINKQRLSIACGVASGMAFLHDRGYIHADLKPGNVSHPRHFLLCCHTHLQFVMFPYLVVMVEFRCCASRRMSQMVR